MSKEIEQLEAVAADARLRVKGWDSYDAEPLDDRAVEAARKFLGYLWAIVPTNDGGLQLERHDSQLDIEVAFNPDGSVESAFVDVVVAPEREPEKV